MSKYWEICVEEALTEAGIKYTPEQLKAVTEDIVLARDMESESCGYVYIPNPLQTEIDRLKEITKKDRESHTEELQRLEKEYKRVINDRNVVIWELRQKLEKERETH